MTSDGVTTRDTHKLVSCVGSFYGCAESVWCKLRSSQQHGFDNGWLSSATRGIVTVMVAKGKTATQMGYRTTDTIPSSLKSILVFCR